MPEETSMNRPLIGGLLAAIVASLCCVGPLVLLTLGVGGAWVSNLTALTPYRPIFIGITLLFLGLAFRKLYLVPQVCTPGTPCADPSRTDIAALTEATTNVGYPSRLRQ
jgi:mercuric ion transport protein